MAALQSIRKRGGILIAVIGLALFAFIAEELFRSIETTSNVDRQKVGEVFGRTLSAQEFQESVQELNEAGRRCVVFRLVPEELPVTKDPSFVLHFEVRYYS